MPLNEGAKPGSKGFGENVATEMRAGKKQEQAVAIAYRESGEKKDAEVIMDAVAGLRGKVEVAASKVDAARESYTIEYRENGKAKKSSFENRQRAKDFFESCKSDPGCDSIEFYDDRNDRVIARADGLEPSPFGRQERNAKISESSKEA